MTPQQRTTNGSATVSQVAPSGSRDWWQVAQATSAFSTSDVVEMVAEVFRQRGVSRAASRQVTSAVAVTLEEAAAHERAMGEPTRVGRDWLPSEAIEVAAKRTVLDEPALSSAEVGQVLGVKPGAGREAASSMRRRGDIIGVRQGRQFWYPAFQFDVRGKQVRPVVKSVNAMLGAAEDPWGVASWWVSPNASLWDQRPMDLVGTDQEHEVEAVASTELTVP